MKTVQKTLKEIVKFEKIEQILLGTGFEKIEFGLYSKDLKEKTEWIALRDGSENVWSTVDGEKKPNGVSEETVSLFTTLKTAKNKDQSELDKFIQMKKGGEPPSN